jgi:hypothetical protein
MGDHHLNMRLAAREEAVAPDGVEVATARLVDRIDAVERVLAAEALT